MQTSTTCTWTGVKIKKAADAEQRLAEQHAGVLKRMHQQMVQTNDLLEQNYKLQLCALLQDGLYLALRVVPSGSDHRPSDLFLQLMCKLDVMEANLDNTVRQPTQSNQNGESAFGQGFCEAVQVVLEMCRHPNRLRQWKQLVKQPQCVDR